MSYPTVRAPQSGKKRMGRGFSRSELQEVGLTPGLAKRRRIPVDLRRKTKYEENIQILREILK